MFALSERILVTGAFLVILISSAGYSGSGIAVTGPDQSFVLQQGQTWSSYIRILNCDTSPVEAKVTISQEVADLVTVAADDILIGPGEDQKVSLVYGIPAGFPAGDYEGWIEVSTVSGNLQISVSRVIRVQVTSSSTEVVIHLQKGLNLVCWPGPDTSLDKFFASYRSVRRVWRREDDGRYVSASSYGEAGWWSPDARFTSLRHGEAYFFESTQREDIESERSTEQSRTIFLHKGLNLIGWVGPPASFQDAFPQNSTFHPIRKIWKKTENGYVCAEYFPTENTWWSADPSFTELETGEAYFAECGEEGTFVIGNS